MSEEAAADEDVDEARCGFKIRRLANCGINTLRFVVELLMTAISPEFKMIRIHASAESRMSRKHAPPIGLYVIASEDKGGDNVFVAAAVPDNDTCECC